jgi:hypothetical protein
MFISISLEAAIREIFRRAEELSEEEMKEATTKEQARKDKLMAELKSH